MSRLQASRILVASLLLLGAIVACRRSQNVPSIASISDAQEPVHLDQPVFHCRQSGTARPAGTVQILLDASGSMVGFRETVPTVVNWIQHAVSGLRDTALEIQEQQTCVFNEAVGIDCSDSEEPLPYQAAGSTNLHDAIRAAMDRDLTFLLTDGVAATGTGGSGDCVNGVDAACIARALSDVVHTDQGPEGGSANYGVWVLPLVSLYQGPFYTEELIAPTDFNPAETIDRIRFDVGAETTVRNPRTAADNRLVFDYNGPKALLLFVFARSPELGRDAVQSLWKQSGYQGVTPIDKLRGFSGNLGAFQPMEIYPGFLNQVEWRSLKPIDDPSAQTGTMDVSFEPGRTKAGIRLTCPNPGSGEGVFVLNGERQEKEGSNCAPIFGLPAVAFRLQAAQPEDEGDLPFFIKGYRREGGNASYGDLRVHLACSHERPHPCASDPLGVRWIALMGYQEAANGLAASSPAGIAYQIVQGLSTAHPSREAHRIFAFGATLEAFYNSVAADQKRMPLAELEICHGG